jgi:MFS family permease
LSGPSTSYWSGFLAPVAIVGLGMAVTVAPLTTTVINAVPRHQTGVASGINNAVASVATLLAIAIFGAVTLYGFDRALDRDAQARALSSSVRQAIESARVTFVIDRSLLTPLGADRQLAEAVVRESLAEGIGIAMLLAAALALASAVAAAFAVRPRQGPQTVARARV